ALTVLDYLLHVGSENVVRYAKENLYIVKTLKEFQYIDAEGKDQGANVRQKAKDITALLSDDARLREERQSRTAMRDRMRGRTGDYERTTPVYERPGASEEDRDLQRALEESKRMAQEQEARQRNSEDELQLALELSKREEQERLQSAEKFNELSFAEDWEAPATGVNQYQQQQQQQDQNNFDFFGNDFGGQNGNNMFGNNNQGFDAFGSMNQFDNNNLLQAQPTGFNNPYLQLQQQQLQQQMLAQQQFAQQQLLQQQALQQQQQAFLSAMNNPYQQMMMPQITGAPPSTTGSNNPFSAFAQKQPQSSSSDLFGSNFNNSNNNSNGLNGLNSMNGMNGFGGGNNSFNKPANNDLSSLGDLAFLQSPSSSQPSSQPSAPARKPNPNDEKYAHLAMALANRDEDGIDSFGNVGALRIPAHHGHGLNGGRGANPFQMNKPQESNSLIDISDGSSSGANSGFGAQPTGSRNPFQQAAAGGSSTSPFNTQRGLNAFGTNPPNNPHTPATTFQSNGAYSNNMLF
ncbi:hypothetical protein BGW41_004813, partial [Actinomortierella wolfii]